MTGNWQIYHGIGIPHDGITRLPPPPRWRTFRGAPEFDVPEHTDDDADRRLGDNIARPAPPAKVRRIVNAALYLRRPLLVTGKPGTGKSSLAYSVARELNLGPVLRWPITSRSTLQQGLYHYDAVGRLNDENLRYVRRMHDNSPAEPADIGRYIRLGPLGTALLPYGRPRVLLIDEIDKGDVDLPNDLLNVFEDGQFIMDELARLPDDQTDVMVTTADHDRRRVSVHQGMVQCREFPFIVMTSNGERDFPPAFLRRCLTTELPQPTSAQLNAMIAAHLGTERAEAAKRLVDDFMSRQSRTELAADQLLNVIFLTTRRGDESEVEWREVVDAVLHSLRSSDEL